MITTKKTLERWRRDALLVREYLSNPNYALSDKQVIEMTERILRLTGELIDQQILRKGR